MTYDALEYERQAKALIARNKKGKNKSLKSGSEYLTGLKKGDKIKPVVTIALYLSPDPWDGPRTLHEMLDFVDPDLKSFVSNYRPIIISAEGLPPDQIELLRSDARKLIKFVKYCSSHQDLASHISSDPDMQSIDQETLNTIVTITGLQIPHVSGKEVRMPNIRDRWAAQFEKEAEEKYAPIIAQKDASIAQKDASIAQQASLIDKLTAQLIEAGITPAK